MMMKNLFKIAVVSSGLLLGVNSLAGVGQFEDETTTCYVLKNHKLVKKTVCTYEGSSGGAASGYAVFEATFYIKGYGKVDIVDNWFAEDDGKGGWKNEQSTTTIDGEKAVQRNRDAKTLNILTDKEVEKRSMAYSKLLQKSNGKTMPLEDWLTCYTNKKATNELCYIDNTPR